MKEGKSESMDAMQACCLEAGGLASANLTDKKFIQAAAWRELGKRRSVQPTG